MVSLFGVIALIIIIYHLALFSRFSFKKHHKTKNAPQEPISVIMVVKDGVHHLINSLPALLAQQYNQFEIVIINDNSNDEIEMVMQDFLLQHPDKLKFVNLTSSVTNIQGKKFPLSIGFKSASYEQLLLTEVSSTPSSPYWLQHIARHYEGKTQMVLGYATFAKKKGLLNRLIHYDVLYNAMENFSYAMAGMPIYGNGKNLSYTRSLFMKNRGFTSHNHIPFGDDELFVNRVATKKNCDIEFSTKAQTIYFPDNIASHWRSRKHRHFFTSKFYKQKHRFLLRTLIYSNLLFYITFGISLAFVIYDPILLAILLFIFVVKTTLQYIMTYKSAKKLNEKILYPFILLYDIFFSIFNFVLLFKSYFISGKKIR
jgi:glycosyltransferase involved in cell wall biosynthesis